MFFDRPDNRKQIEQAYRKKLKSQIESKPSFNASQQRDYHPETKQFALIANIQAEQEIRKNKQDQYYAQLREQREMEQAQKQREKEKRKREEELQEQKLRKQNEILREKYEQQIRKEKSKGQQPKQYTSQPSKQTQKGRDRGNKSFQNEKDSTRDRPHKLKPIQNAERQTNIDPPQFAFTNIEPQPSLPTYVNRIQNQPFNYLARRQFRDNYIRELLGERKRMEEQIGTISMLNRVFQGERMKKKEESNRGLQDMRALQKMLQEKSAEYMEGVGKRVRSQNIAPASLTMNQEIQRGSALRKLKDQWRKLD